MFYDIQGSGSGWVMIHDTTCEHWASWDKLGCSWAVAVNVVSSKIKEIRAQHGTIPNTAAAQFSAPHLTITGAVDI